MRMIRCMGTLLSAVVLVMLPLSALSSAQVPVAIIFGPPALPVYDQPPCPGEGYIWTPGYWTYDYGFGDYYWVPATWVMPPEVGLLWTPGYWAWNGNGFVFYDGYWGPQVGFYGGIDYGFGYFGQGYQGGRWEGGRFYYNRSVNNVSNVRYVYNTTVVHNTVINRVSYNGGNGGVEARPTPKQEAAARERHVTAVQAQIQQRQAAQADTQLRASINHGKPPVAATPKPNDFHDHVVKAKEAGAPYHAPENRATAQPNENRGNPDTNAAPRDNGRNAENPGDNRASNVPRPTENQPNERPSDANTPASEQDRNFQKQQEKLGAKQEQQRQKLQQKQNKENQKMQQQKVDVARNQQIEQRHQQQMQQLQQKQQREVEKMQQKQHPKHQPRPPEPNRPQGQER